MTAENGKNWFGIIAFAISLLCILIFVADLAAAIAIHRNLPSKSSAAVTMGIVAVSGLFLDLIAIGLGVGGLFQKSKKALSIAGLSIAAATILVMLTLLLIGTAMVRRQPTTINGPVPSIHHSVSSST